METGASEPCETQGDDVEARARGTSDARPQASAFLVVFSLLDPHSHGVGLEVEEEVTYVELDELGNTKGADRTQCDDSDVSNITQGRARSGEHCLDVGGGDRELVATGYTTQAFERLGPGFDFLLVIREGKPELEVPIDD